MKKKELKVIAQAAAKNIKTEEDLNEFRQAICTTNAIESLNSVIRKAVKKRKLFPRDDSAKKGIYLVILAAAKRWTMPIRDWKPALNRFIPRGQASR